MFLLFSFVVQKRLFCYVKFFLDISLFFFLLLHDTSTVNDYDKRNTKEEDQDSKHNLVI